MAKRLVIDASIARAAGGPKRTHVSSKRCTDFLDSAQSMGFFVVITRDISQEWQKHQSLYAAKWLRGMIARKQAQFIPPADVHLPALHEAIDKHAPNDSDRTEMLKDVHLLEAALVTDKRITSLNESDRRRFKVLCQHDDLIKMIIWVNPVEPDEQCLEWLQADAPADDFRMLGHNKGDE